MPDLMERCGRQLRGDCSEECTFDADGREKDPSTGKTIIYSTKNRLCNKGYEKNIIEF